MDPIFVFNEFVEKFGLFTAVIIFGYVQYSLLVRRESKTKNEHELANSKQQNLITQEFARILQEAREQNLRINALEEELYSNKEELTSVKNQLKIERERAERLEHEVRNLVGKVQLLEVEKLARISELEQERRQSIVLNTALKEANEQIVKLKERVTKLEAENATLLAILTEAGIQIGGKT